MGEYQVRESQALFKLATEAGASPEIAHALIVVFSESSMDFSELQLLLTGATLGEFKGYIKILHKEMLSPLFDTLHERCELLAVYEKTIRRKVPFTSHFAKEFELLSGGITDTVSAQDLATALSTISSAIWEAEFDTTTVRYRRMRSIARSNPTLEYDLEQRLYDQRKQCQGDIDTLMYYIAPLVPKKKR